MAASEVEICNSALAKIGGERIISLADSNERARLLNAQYPVVRDRLLRAHPWNFATQRVALSAEVTPPLFDFGYSYALPSNCLRVLDTDIPGDIRWKVEGRYLLADYAEVNIRYVKKETDVTKYDATFSEALACSLAADICYSIVQSSTLRAQLQEEARQQIALARSFDGQEAQGDRVYADTWLHSRY